LQTNPLSQQREFTKISFRPDLKRFDMDSIDDDLESLLRKRVYDMAGVVPGVKVFYNGERIAIKSFKEYVELFTESRAVPMPVFHQVPYKEQRAIFIYVFHSHRS